MRDSGAPGERPRILLVNYSPPRAGTGRYTRELLHALHATAPDLAYDLLLQNLPGRPDPAEWRDPKQAGSRILIQPRPRWAKPRGYGTAFLANSLFYFPRRIPAGYDLYHFTTQMLGAGVRHTTRAVVTVHDLIARRVRGNHSPLSTWLRRRQLVPLREARGLIFSSDFSRRDFLAECDYPAERTTVALLGVEAGLARLTREEARSRLGVDPDRPILLHVGSEERRKNVESLLDALALLTPRRPDLLLVRVGGSSSRARRRIARHGLERHVQYLGGLSDADLGAWYAAADLFVFPSYYEGFGLPVLEAMRAGCPVIAARATSVPEVVGDAGVLVDDPRDPEAFARAIDTLLDDPGRRAALVQAGRARAAEFTWERTAAQTADAYRRALGTA